MPTDQSERLDGLAIGSEVVAPYYSGQLTLRGHGPIEGLITLLGNEPIVGRGLIAHFRIVLDHGERAIVEP
jgi:hypothetical protein